MNKELQNIINQYAEQDLCLESMVVSSFVINNSLTVQTGLLAEYYLEDIPIIGIESIEDVINVFELAIPKAERTKNGAVYTPKYIRDYIVERVVATGNRELQRCLVIDIACGCGAFLYTLANYLYINCGLSYREALQHLYGVDVSALSVNRCKILLSLAALQNGEILNDDDFKIFQGNSLSFDFVSMDGVAENGGFDIVVGNPPYVRAKHIDNESKALLPNWKVAKTGNADLYLPFFEIAYGILREDGVIGYITLNSFFKSVNARQLRSYFRENNATLEIVDFGNQLVFGKTLAYTCISLIHKQGNGGINYTKGILNSHGFVERPMLFNYISYESLDDHKGWHLNNADVLLNIRKIEGAGKSLGEMFQIKNGIATLANDVYIFRPIRSDESYYYLELNGMEFPIEKGICRDIIKPNILHSEEEIPDIIEKVIFPYDKDNRVIAEAVFMSKYPKAYKYLTLNKIKLSKRDKGEKTYEAWYAFGRSQATNDRGLKLLFPYMTDHPHFVYTDNENMLIYCGYAIFGDNQDDLLVLKRILESSVFDYYMQHTAKPYATGYYSYAKNYVKGFGIPKLNEQQRAVLLSLQDSNDINSYVENLYGASVSL
jgi:adenine-specific DNA-methyltransferase